MTVLKSTQRSKHGCSWDDFVSNIKSKQKNFRAKHSEGFSKYSGINTETSLFSSWLFIWCLPLVKHPSLRKSQIILHRKITLIKYMDLLEGKISINSCFTTILPIVGKIYSRSEKNWLRSQNRSHILRENTTLKKFSLHSIKWRGACICPRSRSKLPL